MRELAKIAPVPQESRRSPVELSGWQPRCLSGLGDGCWVDLSSQLPLKFYQSMSPQILLMFDPIGLRILQSIYGSINLFVHKPSHLSDVLRSNCKFYYKFHHISHGRGQVPSTSNRIPSSIVMSRDWTDILSTPPI